ncbi:MAG: bifunctional acetate--CoA ligase family protein/GNAT family N-acetyltransferase [Gammaproteobacteria bacterium]|nr:bifunctional acetate--CoA ligase family protein/GNAT family N-acetyltransferase [Gammaproteobacteria bacterium]
MTIRTLKSMFNPGSIAVVGQDHQEDAPAALLVRNLIDAGFKGPVLPINPSRHAVSGVLAYRNVASLPEAPELAILTTPLAESPDLIGELGAKGTQAVLLIHNESPPTGQEDATLRQRILTAAQPYRLRILGPDRLGMAIPARQLNATLSQTPLLRGSISVVTQSSTMMHAIIHWGHLRKIGFSHLISLGDQWDVDCSHLLDYLAREAQTRAILLYLENVRNPRRFLSAARAAARVKPVIALKPRTLGEGGADEAIFDAAIGRVGMLRVDTMEHWFNAVKALALSPSPQRNRLFILGNSHSIGLVAGDMLSREGGQLATIGPATCTELARLVPPGYAVDNPLDLGDRAGFAEYDRALELLLQESGASGLLIVHVPIFPDLDREIARAIVARAARSRRPILVSWVGATPGSPAWQAFQEAGVATYRTPEEAVWSCLRLAEYARNQALLMETPSSIPEAFTPDIAAARQIVAAALATGQDPLNIQATRALLTAYQIPLVNTGFAATPEEAARLATELGGHVALKIFSPQITNRADVGGVALALEGPREVFEAATTMLKRVQTLAPDAVIEGFAVQPMLSRQDAYEIAIGVRTGRDFKAGPVLFFGHGGTETQIIYDLAYALPPLNMHLAQELMSRTRIYTKLRSNPGRAVDMDALAMTLLKVSQMVIDLGELLQLDINPLWVGREGVLALSARIRIAPASGSATERLAIRPYPKELEQPIELSDGRSLLLRPILPEDEPALQAMVGRMPPEDVRWRFFQSFKELPRDMAARLTQLDYDREMTLVLTGSEVAGKAAMWGLVSLNADPDREQAEYAIALDRSLAGQGLGALLMRQIIAYARQRGIQEVVGEVLDDNQPMLRLCQALGFTLETHPNDPDLTHVRLSLSDGGRQPRRGRVAGIGD